MRKYRLKGEEDKSQQKIVNKQLPVDTIKEVIDKIFLNPGEMEGWASISPELYQTADELIVACNHNSKVIDYNYKHTIRTKYPDRIYGLDFYMHLINNCKDMEMVTKAIHRLVEFCMRAEDSMMKSVENAKLNNWVYLLERLSKLKKHVLLSYQIML